MNTLNLHTNSSQSSIGKRLANWGRGTPALQEPVHTSLEEAILKTQVAILDNVLAGDACLEAVFHGAIWSAEKLLPQIDPDAKGSYLEYLYKTHSMASEPLSRAFLEEIWPESEEHFLLWANACACLIDQNITDHGPNPKAKQWLTEVVEDTLGTLATIQWLAELDKPSDEQPLEPWAIQTIRDIMDSINDSGEQKNGMKWLAQHLVPKLGAKKAGEWIREQVLSYQCTRKPQDTIPSETCGEDNDPEGKEETKVGVRYRNPSTNPPPAPSAPERTLPKEKPVAPTEKDSENIPPSPSHEDREVEALVHEMMRTMPNIDYEGAVFNAKRQLGLPLYTS